MSETRLRAAVVGCGGMGTSHAGTMASLGEYELVGACDMQKELAERAAAKAEGAKAYTDYTTMLRELKPDVVAVATNNVTHAPLTIEAVKAGVRGVYCEKPMSADYGSAKMMVDACRAAGREARGEPPAALPAGLQENARADRARARSAMFTWSSAPMPATSSAMARTSSTRFDTSRATPM